MAKKYTLYAEKDRITGLEIDGTQYRRPKDIPDERDRARMVALLQGWEDADLYTPDAGGDRLTRIITWVFLAVTALMLTIFTFSASLALRATLREELAPGRVVKMTERQGQNGQVFFYPVVEFELPDGSRHTVQLAQGSWPAAHNPGEQVTIAYNPQQPDEARILSDVSGLGRWTVAIITGALAAAFLIATLFAHWMSKQ
jgi:hypothetical protein